MFMDCHVSVEIPGWNLYLRFRGGLVFKAHRPVYHSTLDLRVIKKKKTCTCVAVCGVRFQRMWLFFFLINLQPLKK